jgi:hypothetical protein
MASRRGPLFYLGLALLIGFALTGQYLKLSVRPAFGDDIAHRMMARANHLYLLFISLLLMISSQIDAAGRPAWIRRAVAVGKTLLALSALLLLVAVITDHAGATRDRQATLYGCILALAGGLFVSAHALGARNPKG